MSFRLFIYYCALCGGWAALLGWGLAQFVVTAVNLNKIEQSRWYDVIMGTCLGGLIAFGVGLADALGNRAGGTAAQAMARVTSRGVIAGLVGLGAGFLGTLIGTGLASVSDYFVVVGWVIVGLAIGVAVGGLEVVARLTRGEGAGGAVRKLINGVVGGGVGGLVGGLLFIVVNLTLRRVLQGENLLSPSAWGAVVLGACIGLLIGMAQVILKEAWVRVEAGFRPGRELILSKDETTIGRGEGCDIALFGDGAVEKLHARLIQKKNRYLVADAGTPGGTFVNDQRVTEPMPLRDGDEIRMGKSVLRFGERAKRKK
jgi:hypothetical protein